jgi:hypothetical protein
MGFGFGFQVIHFSRGMAEGGMDSVTIKCREKIEGELHAATTFRLVADGGQCSQARLPRPRKGRFKLY